VLMISTPRPSMCNCGHSSVGLIKHDNRRKYPSALIGDHMSSSLQVIPATRPSRFSAPDNGDFYLRSILDHCLARFYICMWFYSARNNMNLKRTGIGTGRLGLIIFLALTGILYLASRKTEMHAQGHAPQHIRTSAIDDWSHHHAVYSRPSSVAQSLKVQSEPRYQQQLQKRNAKPYQSAQ
jgi:hypothetical protein